VRVRRQCAIPQAPSLELRQKMAGIVRRVGVPEHIQVEQDETIARPEELTRR